MGTHRRRPRFIHSPLWGQESRRLHSVWVVDEGAERYGEAHEELVDRQTYDQLTRGWPFGMRWPGEDRR